MVMLIILHGLGLPPLQDENWKILARAQLFQNSSGLRVIDGSFPLSTQMWSLADKALSAWLPLPRQCRVLSL